MGASMRPEPGRIEKNIAALRAQGADDHDIEAYLTQHEGLKPEGATPDQQFAAVVGQGATLNQGAKILGGLNAAKKMLPHMLGGEGAPASDFGKNYTATRDAVRSAAAEGIENHPIAGRVAEMAGGVITTLPFTAGKLAVGAAAKVPLLARIGRSAATGAGIGAVAGAGNATGSVMDYAKHMGAGALGGALVGGVMPSVLDAASSATGRLATTFGLRPTGRTAEEIAADAATMKAPVGPQAGASATPTLEAVKGRGPALPRSGTVEPSSVDRVRAATGRVIQRTGVESSKTRALREVGRRFELDNVTEPDALAYAERAGSKPLAVLDLGGGNVSGLARTAKDVPSLARRQIPEFLNSRSAGTTGDEGATLQRITSDIENHIGLKPEDYYANVTDMTKRMKSEASVNYSKVRDIPVDDPEVLSLFDEPEFQAIHERLRANARLGGKEKIPPLSTTSEIGGEKVRTLNPQTLGTLDKVKRQLDKIVAGKSESVGTVDRDLAYNMRERVHSILDRMDELHPDYGKARAAYRGSAEGIDAYERGKDELMKLDPRAIKANLSQLPERLQDLYRRGGYDALRTRLSKMDDGANIGAFLEKNPDIRDRVASLAKAPDDAAALRGDIGIEREFGNRKAAILGGPNTAERIIEHEHTKPVVTHIGNALRTVPGLGKTLGGLVDNSLSRRMSEQTGEVMSEVGKVMTRTGKEGVGMTFKELQALRAADMQKQAIRDAFGGRIGGVSGGTVTRKR